MFRRRVFGLYQLYAGKNAGCAGDLLWVTVKNVPLLQMQHDNHVGYKTWSSRQLRNYS
jgi:hypothetical protein